MKRQKYNTNTTWEKLAGYSRAVKIGNIIYISGTTATGQNGKVVGENDPKAQAEYIIGTIFKKTLEQFGASLENIVRTRIYVKRIEDWEAVARVHGEYFGDIRPANTLIEANLVGEEYLVEIEAEGYIN